ncbi:succinate dehydrogenase [Heliorestis acidaminivorans]|uniref:Succinate dehydrogenase n=1 Tax=Heliorestis acidaminivorans TaxID=553427 RepID=A0A6I0F2F4_9FIRM|nr:succinate dehydrogenase cytochrome b558 subunit [Heliorestis acidaminivorans]KAB2952528.1 succinate dehydrogenase [Heliorestis acidaminivorans]
MGTNNHFAIRKVHSLLGIIPIGFFFLEHTITNSMAILGEDMWMAFVSFLHNLPFKIFLEVGLIFLPIAFHALYGLWIVYGAKNNTLRYSYFKNWMFYLQRITAIITLVFIIWHVWTLKTANLYYSQSYFQAMGEMLSNPLVFAAYLIGFLAAAFHFTNGIWSFLVAWGVTVGPKAQKVSFALCMGFFALLSAAGIGSLISFLQ